MGLFLETVILKNKSLSDFNKCLPELTRDYPDWKGKIEDFRYLIHPDAIGIIFQNDYLSGYEMLAHALSEKLHGPVFLLYIYDDDYWGYHFYDNGSELDSFSPIPDYFTSDENNLEKYKGNAQMIADYFQVAQQSIEAYLIRWTADLCKGNVNKAYTDDKYCYGNCWQMTDFMKKLGYPYSYDDEETTADTSELLDLCNATLNQIISQKLPPLAPFSPPHKDHIWYTVGNLPNAFDYSYIEELLLSVADDSLADLGEKTNFMAANLLSKVLADKSKRSNSAYATLLAFCYHYQGKSRDRYYNLYTAVDADSKNILLLRTRGLVAAIQSKLHVGIKDMTKLLELDPENRDVYLLCRAFFNFEQGSTGAADADLQKLIESGQLPKKDDPRICWDGFTEEFRNFLIQQYPDS